MAKTHLLGYPRIGAARELKFAVEAYWQGEIDLEALEQKGRELRVRHWRQQQLAGIDLLACNDFSYYDHMLDMSCVLGHVPERFGFSGERIDIDMMFRMARGKAHQAEETAYLACEMTKWFDTNYHYIVPEFSPNQTFHLASDKPVAEFIEARDLGYHTKPVLVGPVTYLALGKISSETDQEFNRYSLIDRLIPVYKQLLQGLAQEGAEWVQLDEPVLALDLEPEALEALKQVYTALAEASDSLPKLMVATYFGPLHENLKVLTGLPVQGIHLDLVRAKDEVLANLAELPDDKVISVGIVDGRNVWRNHLNDSRDLIEQLKQHVPLDRLWIAPSCSLLHVPVSLASATLKDEELAEWLAYAEEKLGELKLLVDAANGQADDAAFAANASLQQRRSSHARVRSPDVRRRCNSIVEQDAERHLPYASRVTAQRGKLQLPFLPTTTIGSLPQTSELRRARAKFRKGEMDASDYNALIETMTRDAINKQNELNIDVLVHGEFERNDMVQYFGEKLQGMAIVPNAWVQSYGSRCVNAPVIYGDVSRPEPMTVHWSTFAKNLTQKPMKGMLTGPITMLKWSFVRDDQPLADTAIQIAMALRDEVNDLERQGIHVIQVDEPAFREAMPLKRELWNAYFKWASQAFRLSTSGVKDETQIHTHMCYSEFNEIIEGIASLDADVISIETSRSRMELLDAFVEYDYPNEIGPGVYDIHSPRIPSVEEMVDMLEKACKVIAPDRLWINPDCGLKTRRWEEVMPALANMVEAAQIMRKRIEERQ